MYRDVRMSGPRMDARLGQTFGFLSRQESNPPAGRDPQVLGSASPQAIQIKKAGFRLSPE